MCGITGWIDWERDLTQEGAVLQAMTKTLACRGPDDEGTWLSVHAAIGHRRLAIIDIAGGSQPMVASPRGRPESDSHGADVAVLTYAGELYNYRELRVELTGRGHRFHTQSDTEVLLRSYLEWGPACVHRFNGMFSFAIWDEERQELLLARDRLGIKPLYYYAYQGGLVFGSEPKALLAHPDFRAELDEEGLGELFAMFGSRTPGMGVLRGLEEVRPGWIVRVRKEGVFPVRYWNLVAREHADDRRNTIATVRHLLEDTVERQLVSDVPLCALVSGGIDSSALAALATRSLAERDLGPLATFSVDFRDSATDFVADAARPSLDAPYVRALVAHIGSKHTDVSLATPDLLDAQRNATLARDLPCLGDLDGSLYLLFAAIRGRTTVALSGESADEVFGGYNWFHDADAVGRHAFPWTGGGAGLGEVLSPALKQRVRPEEYLADRYSEALAELPHLPGETGTERRMREICYLALTRHLPMLLDRKDRMSMAVGVEVRVPFCDHRLVEYVWNVPWRMKALDGQPKGLLRAAVEDLLPESLGQRPKSVFPAPPDPLYDRTVRARARGLVDSGSTVGDLLDPTRVRALADGTSARPPWMQRLALAYLVELDYWLKAYGVNVLVSA